MQSMLRVALAFTLALAAPPRAQVRAPDAEFVLRIDSLEGPAHVTLRLQHPPERTLRLLMPAWSPGSYRLVHHGARVQHLRARDGAGADLALARLQTGTWELDTAGADLVEVSYEIPVTGTERFANRSRSRQTVTLEGPATWIFVAGHLRMQHRVRFLLPEGWAVATGLPRTEDPMVFAAPDYDVLADCPIKAGRFELTGYESGGIPYEVVLDGPPGLRLDREAFVANLRRITDYQVELFGEAPFPRYVFLFTLNPGFGGGGLEHLNSTSIALSARSLAADPKAGSSVIAHEFFHAWNVKRIRPEVLGPFDYTRDVRTKALWFCEGVTSYYADLTLVRTGITTEERFWSGVRGQMSLLENNPARHAMSVETASWTTWDAAAGAGRVNYYNKGLLLGLLLDLTIREHTSNTRSLDDVLRALYYFFARHGRGFAEEDIRRTAEAVAGADLGAFFDRYVAGTVPLPYRATLAFAGMDAAIEVRSRRTIAGLVGLNYAEPRTTSRPARGGLRGRVLAIDGTEVATEGALDAVLQACADGAEARLAIRLDGGEETREVRLRVTTRERSTVTLVPMERATERQLAIRAALLAGRPGRPASR
jgi:predicted metalloprotease with PDZ domain